MTKRLDRHNDARVRPPSVCSHRDLLIGAVLFFVVSLALRLPFQSQLAYHWDGAQFALAIKEYNLAVGQPHAPGYFLYVMLGRVVNNVVGDPHTSLVWMSLIFGSALVATVYVLGQTMFGQRTGIAAGLFALTSPQLWFHSCVALTYVVDSFLVCTVVLWCWWAVKHGGTWLNVVGIGASWAVASGVRLQSAPALVPVMLFAFWRFDPPRWRKLGVAALTAAAVGLAWFVPMLRMSGGLPVYLEVMRRHATMNAPNTLLGGGGNAFLLNVFFMGVFVWNGLVLGAALLAGGLVYRVFLADPEGKRVWDGENRLGLWFLALWILPMMLLWIVGVTRQPGHVLGFVPALLVLAAAAAAQLQRQWVFAFVTAIVSFVNVVAFTAWPSPPDGVFFHAGQTARAIRQHDRELKRLIETIRARYDPADTIVCHAAWFPLLGLRHTQLYLPEFDQCQLQVDPTVLSLPGRSMMYVHGGRVEFANPFAWAEKRIVLLVVPRGRSVNIFQGYFDWQKAEPVDGTDGMLYELTSRGSAS